MKILGIFARYPEPGRTKTRLAAAVGDAVAADLYDGFVRDLTERLSRCADAVWLAVTPDTPPCRAWVRTLPVSQPPAACRVMAQPDGDLGERMEWFFDQVAPGSDRPVVLVGTDSPDLPRDRVERAFEILAGGQDGLAVVPATDGGCVLIGLACHPDGLFREVRWSSPQTLLDLLQAARRRSIRFTVLSPWYDVDTVDGLGTLAGLLDAASDAEKSECPVTAERIRSVFPRQDG